ncbi:MAG: dihydrodipicolinate synthase family protein [Acidimicrobiia bacterium]|nr:dihydrodipicolinate synthase family protein [Acidimicrobiia bacterium]
MRTPPTVMPALVTPFTRRGDLDGDAHVSNVAELERRGLTGFVLAGSTGQGPYLEPDERRRLVEGARRAAPAAYLLCGVAAESLRGALAQIDEAAGAGADASLVLTPTTLVRGRHRLVRRFFADVADRSPLPVFLYSVPGVTGYELPVDVVADLAAHDTVVGMKDSGGHPVRARSIVASAPEGFLLYGGASRAVALTRAAGARGAITASANYAAALVGKVVGARSMSAATEPQDRLTRLVTVVERHGLPGTSAAADLTGLDVGTPRRPLRPVTASVRRDIASALDAAGIPVR